MLNLFEPVHYPNFLLSSSDLMRSRSWGFYSLWRQCQKVKRPCRRVWTLRLRSRPLLTQGLRVLFSNVDECVHLTIWHRYVFSVSLKFGAYYITGQCGAFIKKCYLMLFFAVFHHKICVFFFLIKYQISTIAY